ncbi:DUF3857 domain-containing transglutaminase family protein [Dyadobacter psychrotolerans]|uniref:DUF3857 domain-containing protein n=1 Tax=Dyadobacter psychrotolerans TaxID=2541721 RepID=A0A4R5DQQ4_9BACT|nr:DUF3857 domain-containing protein [Dyadobacter psychrotolerans]TDE14584.1 DUF3857 domain-containing protein [Dyadobacter psychrotolerans]
MLAYLLLAHDALATPSVGIKPVPSWIVPVTPGGKPPSVKDFSDGYYFSFIDTQVHLEKKTTYQHIIRQIASETGVQNGSEISVVFDPSYEHIDFHKILVWREGKIISIMKASDFKLIPVETDRQRFIYNGSYSASVVLNDIRKGDKIEYAYSITGWNSVFQNKYSNILDFGVYDYVAHKHYAVVAEKSRKLYIKEFNKPPKKTIRKENKSSIYEWDLKDIKNIKYQDYVPSWFDNQPRIQLTEYKNWDEVVKWGLEFYRIPELSGTLKLQIQELKKKANGNRNAYIELASRFVQDEIRYLGIETGENSHRPQSPDDVFRQRYGDCKDKAFLLCALLKANGIDSDPLLVDTNKRSHVSDYLPSPADFNHVVVRVRMADEDKKMKGEKAFIFIDATYSMQGGTASMLHFPAYGTGLLLREGQDDLIPIPLQNSGYLTVEEEFNVPESTAADATGSLVTKTIYFEGEADDFRSQFQQGKVSELEETYLDYYRTNHKHAEWEMADSLEYYDQREANNFSLIERYAMKNPWQYDSTRQKYYFSVFSKLLYDQVISLPNKPRTDPMFLKFPYHLLYTIKILMPGFWTVDEDEWKVKREAYEISFKSEFDKEANAWMLNYEYKTLRDHITPEESDLYKKDIAKLLDNLDHELTKPASAGNGENSKDLSSMILGGVGFFVGLSFMLGFFGIVVFFSIKLVQKLASRFD